MVNRNLGGSPNSVPAIQYQIQVIRIRRQKLLRVNLGKKINKRFERKLFVLIIQQVCIVILCLLLIPIETHRQKQQKVGKGRNKKLKTKLKKTASESSTATDHSTFTVWIHAKVRAV